MLIAGLTFGWKYALYSMITIFVSSRVTDAVFTKQKRMQAMIVTSQPDAIIEKIHKNCIVEQPLSTMQKEPITIRKKAVLLTVITRAEFNEFKYIMKKLILRLLSPFQKTFISLDALWKQKNKIKVTTLW